MANATEKQIKWSRWQFYASVAGIGGLLVTLGFTAVGTLIAIRATQAAEKSNEIARASSVDSHRAWLSLGDVRLIGGTQITKEGISWSIQATAKNLGQTPATSVWIDFNFFFPDAGSAFQVEDGKGDFLKGLREHLVEYGATVFPQDPHTSTRHTKISKSEIFERAITINQESHMLEILVIINVGVTYRIVGDASPHITYQQYVLHAPLGYAIRKGESVELKRMPFTAGEVT